MNSSRIACALALVPISLLNLTGCGSRSETLPAPAPAHTSPDIAGAWLFSEAGDEPVLAAGLSEKTGVVTGTGTVYVCSSTPEQTTLHGTVSSGGELTLETAALAKGQVMTFHGQLSTDGKSSSNVTAVASGTGCNLPVAQTLKAQVYAPAQGNYTGTFVGADGAATPVTATLSQSSNAGPGGGYTLSGSVSFPSSPCLETATINSAQSTVTGGTLSATYVASVAGQIVTVTATGTADANAANIAITSWTIAGGSCDGYSGTGELME